MIILTQTLVLISWIVVTMSIIGIISAYFFYFLHGIDGIKTFPGKKSCPLTLVICLIIRQWVLLNCVVVVRLCDAELYFIIFCWLFLSYVIVRRVPQNLLDALCIGLGGEFGNGEFLYVLLVGVKLDRNCAWIYGCFFCAEVQNLDGLLIGTRLFEVITSFYYQMARLFVGVRL